MRSLLFRPQAWFAALWIALSLGAVPVSRTYRAAEPEEPAALRREARAVVQWEKTGRLPLNARVRSQEEKEGLVWEQLTYVGGPGQVVPALLARPAGAAGRLPAVIALHGLGGSKESMRSWLEELAERGYLALAIDARWHGERGPGLRKAMIRAYRSKRGNPYVLDTVADLFRALDYLQTRADVAADRIGMFGISMGGQETWITAALDTRVRAAVPIIGTYSYAWPIENDQWQRRARLLPDVYEAVRDDLDEPELNARVYRSLWEQVTPGMLDRFDAPQLLPLVAPRPLLVLGGETDPLVPLPAARLAAESARRAYAAAGVPNRFRFEVTPDVGHTVTPEQRRLTLEWFDRWLKPPQSPMDPDRKAGTTP